MVDPLHKPSDKADRPERRPGLGLAQRGAGWAQAAARNTVKRGARAAAPAPQASLTVSRQPSLRVAENAASASCSPKRGARYVRPRRRALARATAIRRAHSPLRCTASQVQRCAGPPRLRSPSYDLRRTPRIHPHFASNAIRGGLNQRFHGL